MAELIYISSTYIDLKDFRQTIRESIRKYGDYYKVISMEDYDAQDIPVVEQCIKDVRECNIYILLLGKRYGYKPKDYQKSITEIEYETALNCKQNGQSKEILVFKVGELCTDYNYQELKEYIPYQQNFWNEVTEILSPKPFDSKAELSLQVINALMKRLLNKIRVGERPVTPDKETLCYINRTSQITTLKDYVSVQKKKVYFIYGNRKEDFPSLIVKRFAKYSLGSINKIEEPFIKITDFFDSFDTEMNERRFRREILDYLNRLDSAEKSISMTSFLEELSLLKSENIIIPFYYHFISEEDEDKIHSFFNIIQDIFYEYTRIKPVYKLYFIIAIYSPQPDPATLSAYLEKYASLKSIAAPGIKLKSVDENDVIDWLAKYIATDEKSSFIYNEYFGDQSKYEYHMQEVYFVLDRLIADLAAGNERITKLL
jgi:hypothetical protein